MVDGKNVRVALWNFSDVNIFVKVQAWVGWEQQVGWDRVLPVTDYSWEHNIKGFMHGDFFGRAKEDFPVSDDLQVNKGFSFLDSCSVDTEPVFVETLKFDVVIWSPFVLKITDIIDHGVTINDKVRNNSELCI